MPGLDLSINGTKANLDELIQIRLARVAKSPQRRNKYLFVGRLGDLNGGQNRCVEENFQSGFGTHENTSLLPLFRSIDLKQRLQKT